MINWQQVKQRFLNSTSTIIRWLLKLVVLVFQIIFKLFKFLAKYFVKKKSTVFSIFGLLLFGSILAVAIFPSVNNFEGNLIVQQMNFTYAGNKSSRFLTRIPNIQEVDIKGIQTLSLSGDYQSKSNRILDKYQGTLEIQLNDETSHLIITPVNPESFSKLEIRKLILRPQTEVTNLIYNPYGSTLAFSLNPESNQISSQDSNRLQLYLSKKPLNIVLEKYNLPKLGIKDNPDAPVPLEFTLMPSNLEQNLFFEEKTDFYFKFPKPTEIDLKELFSKRLAVRNMQFLLSSQTGFVAEKVPNSSIIEGEILMAGQELEIKPNQFLMTGEPGIQLLRDVQILPDRGLRVRVAGKSREIEVGLDYDFPVASIKAGRLAQFFSPEIIPVIVSFFTTVLLALISWLFKDFSNSSNSN